MSVANLVSAGLDSTDPEERRRATGQIAQVGGAERVRLLSLALADDDWRVRKEATLVARALAPSPDVLEGLVRALSSSDNVGLVNAAVEALSGFGADAVDALSVALQTFDADARKLAAETLALSQEPAALFVLRDMIEDADPNVRAAAIEAVARIGVSVPEEAAGVLQRCLDDGDAFLRLVALDGLNQLRVSLPWARLNTLIEDPISRRAALVAMGYSAQPEAVGVLASALADHDGTTFAAALASLGEVLRRTQALHAVARTQLSSRANRILPKLTLLASPDNDDLATRRWAVLVLGAFDDSRCASLVVGMLVDDKVFAEAEEALELLGLSALDPLLAAARSEDPALAAASIQFLAGLVAESSHDSPEVLEALLAALSHENPAVVRSALDALSLAGKASALPPLVAALEHPDAGVRHAAEAAVSAVALRFPDEAVEMLSPQHGEQSPLFRALVVEALGSIGRKLEGATPFLSNALSHESMRVRRAALDALATLGEAAPLEEVSFAVTDEQREVRIAAIRALGAMKDTEGRPLGLGKLLELSEQSDDSELLAEAVSQLGALREPEAIAALRRLTHANSPLVAVRAVEAIASQEGVRAVDELLEGLSSAEPEVVKSVMRALARSEDPRAAAHLGACLDHDLWDVRRLAADLLAQVGGDSNARLLFAKLVVEKEPLVRDAIERALESLGELKRTVIPARTRSSLP